MKFSNPATRGMLLLTIFVVLLTHVVWRWVSVRFVLADAQNRILAAQYYEVQVVTGEEYRRLSDPAIRETTLSDGTTIIKSPIWNKVMLPGYKRAAHQDYYVLVTTKGTAHVLSYIEQYLLLFGSLAVCGLFASFWNLKMMLRESMTKKSLSDSEMPSVDA